MQAWVGTAILVFMFVAGVVGTIVAAAQRQFPNSAYAKQSKTASAMFVLLAVFSAFYLFR